MHWQAADEGHRQRISNWAAAQIYCLPVSLSHTHIDTALFLTPSFAVCPSLALCNPHAVKISASFYCSHMHTLSLFHSISLSHRHTLLSLLPLPYSFHALPFPLSYTLPKPYRAGDFISLATSSVLQRKHLRCFICLSCCPFASLLPLFPPPLFSTFSLAFFILHFGCYVCDLLFRQEIKFSLFVPLFGSPFSAKTQTNNTHPAPRHSPSPHYRLVPKIYCVVAEFNYKDDNAKRRLRKGTRPPATSRSQTQPDSTDKCSAGNAKGFPILQILLLRNPPFPLPLPCLPAL